VAQQPRLAVESIPGKRPYQEDSVFADVLTDGRALVAVADGMGGHAAGEVASALALRTLQDALAEGKELGDAFRLANARVHQMATEPGKQGMGTTMVAVLVDGANFRVANVGDSRVYMISASGIRQLTEDHSFVAEAMKRGQSKAEAMATPWRDALTRSIGTDEEVEVDVFGPFPVEGDSAFIICSDGAYKTLSDDDLHELFVQSSGPRGAAQAMVTAAFDGGSDDNISVAIAEYGQVPRETAPTTQVLQFDASESNATVTEIAVPPSSPKPDLPAAAIAVEEGVVAGGLPVTAVVAVTVVVVVLLAILVFGL
jgi:protein phosphatase